MLFSHTLDMLLIFGCRDSRRCRSDNEPVSRHPGAQIVSTATADPVRAIESLEVIAQTQARTVLVGHGEPWNDGAESLVERAREHGPS